MKAKFFRSNWFPLILFFLISLILLGPMLLKPGLPFKYDWSWPFFDMKIYFQSILGAGNQGLQAIFGKNFFFILGLLCFIKFPPELLLKIFLVLAPTLSAYGFFLFIRQRVQSKIIAYASPIIYAFTPYIFIRTITGFSTSICAYAALPYLLHWYFGDQKSKWIVKYLIIGFLFALVFSQAQAGILLTLVLVVDLIISIFRKQFWQRLKHFLLTMAALVFFHLPWIISSIIYSNKNPVPSGGEVTTLKYIADLPHSLRNVLMLSDHQIARDFFYALSRERLFILGFGLFFLVMLCSAFNKRQRRLVLAFGISSLLILPFTVGPTGLFQPVFAWFFNHFPFFAIFRETYHFEFLLAVSWVLLFSFGADWLVESIPRFLSNKRIVIPAKAGIQSLLVLPLLRDPTSAGDSPASSGNDERRSGACLMFEIIISSLGLFIIAPYLTFNFAGYLKLQTIPPEYSQLKSYLTSSPTCRKIYYPPDLGFIYFKNDASQDAANSDLLADNVGVSYLGFASSVLSTASPEMFYRNHLTSEFLEKIDDGSFTSLFQSGGLDCLVMRTDIDTKYDQVSGLWRDPDKAVREKWFQSDMLALARNKVGFEEVKHFGDKIFVFKVSPKVQKSKSPEGISLGPPDSELRTYLPIFSWASNDYDYREGWSRGRYTFWRKNLFAGLEQDFIYTTHSGTVLTGKINARGDYELWVRYLNGGTPGEVDIKISTDNRQPTTDNRRAAKEPGEERFVWKDLGPVTLDDDRQVTITNISGENAVADLVLVQK